MTPQQFHDDFKHALDQLLVIAGLPDKDKDKRVCRLVGRIVKMLIWQMPETPVVSDHVYVRDLISLLTDDDYVLLAEWSAKENKQWFRDFAEEYSLFRNVQKELTESVA